MKLAFQGFANYTGTFIPYQGRYTFKTEGTVMTNAMVMVDSGSVTGRLSVTGVSGGGLWLTGNSTFSGGVDVPELRQPRAPEMKWVTRKAVKPGEHELNENPRSRSAQLRVLEKI